MSRSYVTGSCTKEDPLVYHVTDEFLDDLENGRWVEGMHAAAVKEIRKLRAKVYELEARVTELGWTNDKTK